MQLDQSDQDPAGAFRMYEGVPPAGVAERMPDQLAARGHRIEVRPAYSEGHVLAVRCDRSSRTLQAAADPRGQLSGVMPAMALGW